MWNFGKKKDIGTLVAEGHSLLQAGKAAKAAAKFKQATEADPTHAEAWYCLGTIHSGSGELEQAIACYQQSAQYAPVEKQAIPLFNMGNALQALGRVDQALEIFTLVTNVDPE